MSIIKLLPRIQGMDKSRRVKRVIGDFSCEYCIGEALKTDCIRGGANGKIQRYGAPHAINQLYQDCNHSFQYHE